MGNKGLNSARRDMINRIPVSLFYLEGTVFDVTFNRISVLTFYFTDCIDPYFRTD